jgi:hypothetical protein
MMGVGGFRGHRGGAWEGIRSDAFIYRGQFIFTGN